MKQFGKAVVKCRGLILALAFILLIPSAFGYLKTRVNYDILSYLPENLETMEGQDILQEEFGCGAFSMCVLEGMEEKEVVNLKSRMEKVEHVKDVIWYDTIADLSVPVEVLPEEVQEAFINQDTDSTLMLVLFDSSMSSDETMKAVAELRKLTQRQCYISGMSAVVTDIKDLSARETPIYVLIAVILAVVVLSLTMDSFLVPFLFLLSIAFAIVYNMGSNLVLGEISYVTKALSAVLQLGVTMDYSIFLWHSYEEEQRYTEKKEDAMAKAISHTFTSVVGSSVTTVAGFIALCFMSFTLGVDLGIVMAKGVVLGVICCVTVLPSFLLAFDKALEKTKHRPILPDLGVISKFVVRHYKVFFVLFFVLLIPALYGYRNTPVYYDLAGTLPKNLESKIANEKLEESFGLNSTHIVLMDSSLEAKEKKKMLDELEGLDGVKAVLGVESVLGPAFPQEMIPKEMLESFESENYEIVMVSSEYAVASDEVNAQCDQINGIIKRHDPGAMLIGEAPCTKDLIHTTDTDFKVVSMISIVAIFVIIAIVFRSLLLPVILVAVIEFAIFINMGLPTYTGNAVPFIASVVIGTIQLGSTVDYAILMTTRYKTCRNSGMEKQKAVSEALRTSTQSVIVSALSFFAATFGVGIYSNIDMISSLCTLMARGALISMAVVLFVLPAMVLVFDKWIFAGGRIGRSTQEDGGESYEI